MERRFNDNDKGNPKYWGKSCPIVTLSTTNDTRRQREKQETKTKKMMTNKNEGSKRL
jgi:hypothetical protein